MVGDGKQPRSKETASYKSCNWVRCFVVVGTILLQLVDGSHDSTRSLSDVWTASEKEAGGAEEILKCCDR